MESKLTLLNLYQAIIDDCKIIIENNVEKEWADEMNRKVKKDIKELVSLLRDILHISQNKGNLQTFAVGYLDTILENRATKIERTK